MLIRGVIVILGIWSQIAISSPLTKETVVDAPFRNQKKVFKGVSDPKITKEFPGTRLFPDLHHYQNGFRAQTGIWSQIAISSPLTKETVVDAPFRNQKKVFKGVSDPKITKEFPGTRLFPDLHHYQNGFRAQTGIKGPARSVASRCAPGTPLWLILLLVLIVILLIVNGILTLFICKKWRRSISGATLATVV